MHSASGSSRWASNPAEMRIRSGPELARGGRRRRAARRPRNSSSPAPAGTGRLIVKPSPGARARVRQRPRARDRTATGGCSRTAPRARSGRSRGCRCRGARPSRARAPAPPRASRSRAGRPPPTLENRQKPIARSASAWWPGGRSPQKPVGASPASSASASAHAAPAARRAASHDPGLVGVSRSNGPPRLAVLANRHRRAPAGARRAAAPRSRAAPRAPRSRASPARSSSASMRPDPLGALGVRARVVLERGGVAEVERRRDRVTVPADPCTKPPPPSCGPT